MNEDHCQDIIASRIERSLTNIYLTISDDYGVNNDQRAPLFKESILAVASEFLGVSDRYRSTKSMHQAS